MALRAPRGDRLIHARRNPWRDAAWLFLLCIVAYTAGLTTHGLTNWQEARRAAVAREMYATGEWIVPRWFGEPYIAKPPMMYWAQILVAKARAALGEAPFIDESEVRLTVAIAGLLGVLTTYFAARSILRDRLDARLGDDAAWLAALGLASGVLYFRSSRIGELDVLTVPFVVAAVWAIDRARRVWEAERHTPWMWVGLATAAGIGAALTKGPPAVLPIALAGYLPMMLRAIDAEPTTIVAGRRNGFAMAFGAGVFVFGTLAFGSEGVGTMTVLVGAVLFGMIGGIGTVLFARLAQPPAARRWFAAFARTHPALVLCVPLIAVWVWGRLVAARVGADTISNLAAAEVEDNLRILVVDSPVKNLGFMLYGIAPIALAAAACLVWIARSRPSLTPGQRIPIAWTIAGFAAFSALGKGVARYLTPLWPGVAMLGGLWLAVALRDAERRSGHTRHRTAVVGLLVVSALVQTWWYGLGRTIYSGDRSPREFVRELLATADDLPLATWRLDEPSLDFYASTRLPQLQNPADLLHMANLTRGMVLIGREDRADEWAAAAGDAGFRVHKMDLFAPYRWRAARAPVAAWRIER